MIEKSFEISIPLDEEGFVELECDYCKMRFMLHKDVYDNKEYLYFFCPICGLPNKINTFFTSEVLEKVKQMATNHILNEMSGILDNNLRQINKNGFIKMSVKKTKTIHERELYKPTYSYVKCRKECCEIDVKVKNIDKETGTYCPICGFEE